MELLYFFQIVLRNIWKIIACAVIFAVGSGLYAAFLAKPEYKTTIIFQTAAKVIEQQDKGVDPLAYFEAADRFSEAMLGWFRNPIVFEEISAMAEGIDPGTLGKIFSIRRQEKQNINITFTTVDSQKAKTLGEAIVTYIRNRIGSINTQSNSSYDIVNVASKTELVQASVVQFLVFGGIAGAILGALLVFLWEYLRGVVMYRDQIQKVMGVAPIDTLTLQDFPFLTAYLQQLPGNMVLFTGNYAKPLVLSTLSYLAQTLHITKTLIDASQKGDWVPEDAKGHGFMDESQKPLATTTIGTIPAIPRGKGNTPRFVATKQSDQLVLVSDSSTGLIAIAHGYTPVIFVKLGVTKITDLHRIRALQESAFHIFLIR